MSATPAQKWDGQGRGSPAGHRFFFVIIRCFGLLPAYLFVVPACLRYVLFDRLANGAIRTLRTRLGLPTTFFSRYCHFATFGISLIDRFSFLFGRGDFFGWECINEEAIRCALARGKGVVLLSAHLGNWEIAGNLLSDRLDHPVNAVMLEAEREALQRAYRPALEQRRLKIIPLTADATAAPIAIMNALRANEIVALLGDRSAGGRTHPVPFLGSPVPFPTGAFAVAAAAGATVIVVFTVKAGLKRYRFEAFDSIDFSQVSRSNRDAAIAKGVSSFAATLETLARRYPCQWYNFYDFWGSSPQ